jgi:hypothetical protein
MIGQHQMMCDDMKTTLSKDTSQGSDLLKACSTKMGHFHQKWPFYRQFISIGLWEMYFFAILAANAQI